jgi:hypothetical protein
MSESTQKHPWDQMEGETDKEFSRFLVFLQLGSGRNLRKAQVKSPGKSRKDPKYPCGAWRDMAEKWSWYKRAHAWDVHQAKAGLQSFEELLDAQKRATLTTWAKVSSLAEKITSSKTLEEVKDDVQRLAILMKKTGIHEGLVNQYKASFGTKNEITMEDAREIDWESPFVRRQKTKEQK